MVNRVRYCRQPKRTAALLWVSADHLISALWPFGFRFGPWTYGLLRLAIEPFWLLGFRASVLLLGLARALVVAGVRLAYSHSVHAYEREVNSKDNWWRGSSHELLILRVGAEGITASSITLSSVLQSCCKLNTVSQESGARACTIIFGPCWRVDAHEVGAGRRTIHHPPRFERQGAKLLM